MKADEIEFVAQLVKKRSGQVVTAGMGYLITNRLDGLARAHGHASVGDLIGALRARRNDAIADAITEALTINETSFFRDRAPFERFADTIVPTLSARRPSGALRVWCAACSTGQEPYSLAMIMDELAPKFPDVSLDILASDLSEACLKKARTGIYSRFEAQRGLSPARLARHGQPNGDGWQISARLRAAVRWRRINLLDDLSDLGRFDVLWCRNVLMYLDGPTKSRVLDTLASMVALDGYVVLGATEIVRGLTARLAPMPGLQGFFGSTSEAVRTA